MIRAVTTNATSEMVDDNIAFVSVLELVITLSVEFVGRLMPVVMVDVYACGENVVVVAPALLGTRGLLVLVLALSLYAYSSLARMEALTTLP